MWLAIAPLLLLLAAPAPLTTVAERSGFVRTGRLDEVSALCAAFAQRYPGRARCLQFGTSPEGRPLQALALSADGALDPQRARKLGRPVVLAQGGIHAGEIDGKDAGFLLARELLEGKASPGALRAVTFLFVPVFNVDGHERFGRNNRPNQRGPEEMGWRTTGQNLNLNRDYAKADAPEMRAMLRLLREWDPVLYVDLHVTDGAQFQHDVAVLVEPSLAGPEPLRAEGAGLQARVLAALSAQGHLPLDLYPSFEVADDPASGVKAGVPPPRFSQRLWALHHRLGMLVETHSWKEYPVRVRATRDVLVAVLDDAKAHARDWAKVGRALDAAAAQQGPGEVPLRHEVTAEQVPFDFKGYRYTREPSEVSGALRTRYDEAAPQVWRLPTWPRVHVTEAVQAPRAGYVVPAAFAQAVRERLDLHGIQSRVLLRRAALQAQTFRATEAVFGSKPSEGRTRLEVKGEWRPEARAVEQGALFVPVAQPLGELAVQLLEPRGPDSLLAWGFFNVCFEQREYMEAYVAEEVAREQLRDPAVKQAFEERLAKDPAFAKSAEQRLDFFHRRHPSWDERMDLAPIYRVDVAP